MTDINKVEQYLADISKEVKDVSAIKADKSMVDDIAKKLNDGLSQLAQLRAEQNQKAEKKVYTRCFDSDAQANRFFDFLSAGPLRKIQDIANALPIEKAIAVTSAAAGGYLLPEDFDNTFRMLIAQFGAARRFHNVRSINCESLEYVKSLAVPTASWQVAASDGGTLTEGSGTFANKVITPEVLYCLTYASKRSVMQSRIVVADLVAQQIAMALGTAEDLAVARGDGTSTYGNITGYSVDSDVTEVNVTNLATLVANASGAGYEKLIDVINAVHESVLLAGSGAWYMPITIANSIKKMQDSQNTPLWGNMSNGIQPTLLGYPVNYFQALADGASVGSSGEVIALFGDLRIAGEIVTNGPISVDVSEHYKFGTGQLAWRGFETFGFGIILPTAVARLQADA